MRIPCEVAPFSLSGTVYGTLLNHRSALEAMAAEAGKPPYNALPRAPVLYLKPRNTLAAGGDPVEIPPGIAELEAAACLGIVIGRTACRVSEAAALDHVAGFLIVNDMSVPHSNYFRPAVRYQARDGFCPLGARGGARAAGARGAECAHRDRRPRCAEQPFRGGGPSFRGGGPTVRGGRH